MRIDIAVQTPTSKSVRVAQVSSMFDVPPSEISRVEWHGDVPIEEKDWNVGLIVGPSASGKSIILREKFGVPEQYSWQAASILDEFDVSFSLDEITEICQAVGFNTIPAWMKPFHALCVDEATEIFTARGWCKRDELRTDDLALTLDHQKNVTQWQPIEAIHKYDVIDESVLRIRGKAHSSITTAAHKWPVVLSDTGERQWRESGGRSHQRLNSNHLIITAAPCVDLPSEPLYSDALVELVAWYYTEGHAVLANRIGRIKKPGKTSEYLGVNWDKTRGKWRAFVSTDTRNQFLGRFDREADAAFAAAQARAHRDSMLTATTAMGISQSRGVNPHKVQRIRDCLAAIAGPASARLSRSWRGEAHWREQHTPKSMSVFWLSAALRLMVERLAPDKVPSPEFLRSLTKKQLDIFLEASRLADGWMVGPTAMFAQADPRRTDAYEMAVILSGRTPSRWSRARTSDDKYRGQVMHFCSMTERTTVHPLHVYASQPGGRMSRRHPDKVINVAEWISYTGTVWCPQTANGTWLARRDGKVFFTGNSNGEQFRVELARRLIEGVDKPQVVCDEFTSVVDRQVAQIGANAVQKYIRRAKRKFVAATCHYDLEAWLQPDWVLEPATMTFRWRELQRRPPVQCQIARVENSAWHHFSRFHYMSAELHRGARVYVLFVEGVPAACCAALFRPHPKVQNVYGMSRLVTLPDFQGLGLAFVLCDRVASLYKAQGWRYRAYPAHPGLVRSFDRSKAWKMTIKPGMSLTNRANMAITGMFGGRPNATFEYVGPMGDRAEADSLLGIGKNPL